MIDLTKQALGSVIRAENHGMAGEKELANKAVNIAAHAIEALKRHGYML